MSSSSTPGQAALKGDAMFLVVLTVVVVTIAVVALQNGHPVIVSFLFWQLEAPVAAIILVATAAGLVIGGFVRSVRRWNHRQVGPGARPGESGHTDPPRIARDRGLSPR